MGRTRTREFKESKIWGGIKDSRRLEGGGKKPLGEYWILHVRLCDLLVSLVLSAHLLVIREK